MDGIGRRRDDAGDEMDIDGSVALALGLAAGGADAQSWPDRPVHIVVPLTAGSATDVMARIVARQLSQQLGQPFIVENKPGAGGTIGTAAVARAKPTATRCWSSLPPTPSRRRPIPIRPTKRSAT